MVYQILNGQVKLVAEVNLPYSIIPDYNSSQKYRLNAVTLKDGILQRWDGEEWINFLNLSQISHSFLLTENDERLITENFNYLIV